MTVDDNLETANAPEVGGKWTFDTAVAASFDSMLEKSIPDYDNMRRFVTDAASFIVKRSPLTKPTIIDVGASRGSALSPIIDRIGAQARYLACDVSEPMLDVLNDRFQGWIEAGLMEVRRHDLREGVPLPTGPAAVILSVLTLQFVPIEYRPRLLQSAYDQLSSGGALILVEKVMGSSGLTDDLMRAVYHEHKHEVGGYSQDAIDRKALSLEGVLVPLTANFNEALIRDAGFATVEQIWGWGPFRGWVAVKR